MPIQKAMSVIRERHGHVLPGGPQLRPAPIRADASVDVWYRNPFSHSA